MAHFVPQQLLHRAFTQAEGHNVVGDDDLVGQRPEVGDHMALQHGQHLEGRTGQHQHMDAVGFKSAAGSGAHGIVEYSAALRQFRLLDVVLWHLPVGVPLKKGPDAIQNVLVEHQRLAEGLADGLLRQVIIGGPQAAGGDDDVRPLPGNVQSLLQPLGVISYHGVPEDIDSHGGKGLGDVSGIGVDDVAEEQLRAHGDQLGGV